MRTRHVGRDIPTLLGMYRSAAWAVAGLYVLAEATLAFTSMTGIRNPWPVILAVAICAAATAALLVVRGDPMPWHAVVPVALAGPACCALVFAVIPTPVQSASQLWPFGVCTVTGAFLCVRGRYWPAWASTGLMVAVSSVWAATTGQGANHGLAISLIYFAPLAMSTFLGRTLRPVAQDLFELRSEFVEHEKAKAAAVSALQVRAARAERLDVLIRPMFELAAGDGPIDEVICERAARLNARIRDELYVPWLMNPRVTEAANNARARDVRIDFQDGGALDLVDEQVRSNAIAVIASEIENAVAGELTARIERPRREILGSIVTIVSETDVRRVELTLDGSPDLRL